jgi:reactive intermediate/imine deaminase
MPKIQVQTQDAPAAIGIYSQAIKVANTVYLSGQIPLDPKTMEIVSQDFEAQAKQVFKNLRAVCAAAGGTLDHLVKLTIYVTDLNNFAKVNEVMQGLFKDVYPARATIEVSRLPKDALVEVDGVMVLDN